MGGACLLELRKDLGSVCVGAALLVKDVHCEPSQGSHQLTCGTSGTFGKLVLNSQTFVFPIFQSELKDAHFLA